MKFDDLKLPEQEKNDFFQQLDTFYSIPFAICKEQEETLRSLTNNPTLDCFQKREISYGFLAEQLPIEVFSKCPFAFHYNNRLKRADHDMTGISYWYTNSEIGKRIEQEFMSNISGNDTSGLAIYYSPIDNCHLTIDYDAVLQQGINGILQRVKDQRKQADRSKDTFYAAMENGLKAYIRLATRFSILAEERAQQCTGEDRARLLTISDVMKRIPAQPAENFVEALTVLAFMYYTVPALDGGNVSVLGHVDRLLAPYLQKDIEQQTLTYQQAFDYLWRFIYLPDARWGKNHMGTNCTITIGGCDQDGVPVFNDVTKLIIAAYRKLRCIDPKLNIRLSLNSQKEFLDLVALTMSEGLNNICILNDDVLINANHKMGKALADCRLYVAGGCQENIIASCEQNARATYYMNMLPALFCGWGDPTWDGFLRRFCKEEIRFFTAEDDFEDIYQKTLHNLRIHVTAQINMKNISEARSLDWCASPAHSALLQNCIEKGVDMYAGGTKYAYGSISLAGAATLIDSLLAIKWVIFDKKLLSLESFVAAVKNNFEGYESLRKQIISSAPKYARDSEANLFAGRFYRDAAVAASGLSNTRGGKYEASLFSFRSFTDLGICFPATPDGRLKGEYLSAGMSPTLLAGVQATDVISALKELDLTDYPVAAVTDLKLPVASAEVMESLVQQFIEYGGSALQVNTVKQETLLEAKNHPERHPDLIVRISGYSARFVALTETEQEEVIRRTVN